MRGIRMDRTGGTDAEIELLVPEAADGSDAAWQRLWELVEPRIAGLIRRPSFAGPLSTSEDDCRNIMVEVMGRLRADDCRRLKLYIASRADNPALQFMPWMTVVTKRIAIDYLRGHGQYIDRRAQRDASTPGHWIKPGTLPSDSRLAGRRPPATIRGTAREMLSYAGHVLTEPQARALGLWLQSVGHAEIAKELELDDAKEAERLVRASLERLRRHFRNKTKA